MTPSIYNIYGNLFKLSKNKTHITKFQPKIDNF